MEGLFSFSFKMCPFLHNSCPQSCSTSFAYGHKSLIASRNHNWRFCSSIWPQSWQHNRFISTQTKCAHLFNTGRMQSCTYAPNRHLCCMMHMMHLCQDQLDQVITVSPHVQGEREHACVWKTFFEEWLWVETYPRWLGKNQGTTCTPHNWKVYSFSRCILIWENLQGPASKFPWTKEIRGHTHAGCSFLYEFTSLLFTCNVLCTDVASNTQLELSGSGHHKTINQIR